MEPLRDEKTQLCIPCKAGERGLLVGMIKKSLFNAFDGYVNNPSGNSRKIVENIYRIGDQAFNTGTADSRSCTCGFIRCCSGDVMVADKYGYFYFCDRTGDTFRWKGENVSTVEVENVLMSILKRNDIVVFGVSIPG